MNGSQARQTFPGAVEPLIDRLITAQHPEKAGGNIRLKIYIKILISIILIFTVLSFVP